MKAIRVHELGGAEKLTLEEVEKPIPAADEVLIKTAAAGINYADTMLRQNKYMFSPELPFTLGFEVAGTIEATGANVQNLKIGQRVLAAALGRSTVQVNKVISKFQTDGLIRVGYDWIEVVDSRDYIRLLE